LVEEKTNDAGDTMIPRQRTEALMPALEFTWDDLNYNRSGILSASQQERIGDLFKRQQFFSDFSLMVHAISLVILGSILAIYLAGNNRAIAYGFN
jgi:hypothetical protein